ncbi:choice-of-anchor tandem repeat NxxGxxAF-containing protein [Phormidesmis sp. 146-35]
MAFWGVDASLNAGIFVGDGNSLRTIAQTSDEFSFLGVGPSINDDGTVAFLGGLDSGDAGYFTGDGTTTTLITDSSGQFNFQRIPTLDNLFGEPVINDRGTVGFRADLDNGDKEIFSSKKGKIQIITDANPEFTTFGITPDINAKGTIVFSAGTAPVPGTIEVDGQTVPIAELFQNAGIFTNHRGNLNTIADSTDGLTLFGSSPAINDRGTAAFIAVKATGEVEVLTGKGNDLTTIADSLGDFSSFRGVDINNQGTIAYLADFDAGGSGLFVGQQEIITTGDELLGSTVTELNFLNKGLNQDSVAFWAKLADGRSGVFRADQDKPSKSPFSLHSLYNEIGHYTTTISAKRSDGTVADGDPADIYFPQLPSSYCSTEFPIALLLQGALVDKADYSNFAEQVASYGFVVVVPNNEQTLFRPDGSSATGLFPEQGQVNDVLDQMKVEDQDNSSPLFKIVDTTKLGLLGHSFGGAVGIGATQEEIRIPGLNAENYTVPPELKAGIFYGTSFGNPQTGEFVPINNEVALGLIRGDLDSVSLPNRSQSTYDQILNPPKVLITVKGANHYGITNEDNPVRDPSRPTLDQAAATSAIAQSSGLFLRANLLNDRRAFDAVFNTSTPFDSNVSIISQTRPML